VIYLLGIVALVIAAYYSWRYAWWAPAISYSHPRILMYHMISNSHRSAKFRGLRVSPTRFEKQLRYLVRDGWTFMTMAELIDHNGQYPKKTVVLTFDDGYADNYHQALPIMRRYGAKGTLYLVVDRHHRDWSTYKKAHHDSGELAREPKLSDNQVQEMLDSGIFEIGGHTLTHANLNLLSDEERTREISVCRQVLEERFKTPVKSFAYPFGIYTNADVTAVEAAGYDNAVTTIDGIDTNLSKQPFELRRVKVSGKDNLLAFKLRMRRGKRGLNK